MSSLRLWQSSVVTHIRAFGQRVRSVSVAGIDAVEPAQERGPGDSAAERARDFAHRRPDAGHDSRIDRDQLAAVRLRAHLDHAGCLEDIHEEKRVGYVLADGEQPVITQHQEAAIAEIAHQPWLLVLVECDSFVVVVGERGQHDRRLLRQRQQTRFLRRHGHAVHAVDVQHALCVRTRGMDRAVDREPRGIDVVGAVRDLAPFEVDLDQTRSGDLLEQMTIGVDQEVVLGAGHASRDVREHEIVPAEERNQAITRGEIDALLPFGLAHLCLDLGGAGLDVRRRYPDRHGVSLTVTTAGRTANWEYYSEAPRAGRSPHSTPSIATMRATEPAPNRVETSVSCHTSPWCPAPAIGVERLVPKAAANTSAIQIV